MQGSRWSVTSTTIRVGWWQGRRQCGCARHRRRLHDISCSELDLTDTVRSDGTVSQAESGHLFVSRGWALSTVSSIGHCNTALSLSAGVSNPKVFLGRWFKRNAILFKYD